jgi:hypothetical protein
MAVTMILHYVALVRSDVSEDHSASILCHDIVCFCSRHQLLVTANVPSSLILVTLMMKTLHYSKTSVLTRATWHNIPEDGIQQVLES